MDKSPDSTEKVNPSTSERLRILLAEDCDFNARHLRRLLGCKGHWVKVACTGRNALELLDEFHFDLLLLDLDMPELDGFQVIRLIRGREQSSGERLPVIALTARSREEDRMRGLAAGMDEYLAKPVRAEELLKLIRRFGTRTNDGK